MLLGLPLPGRVSSSAQAKLGSPSSPQGNSLLNAKAARAAAMARGRPSALSRQLDVESTAAAASRESETALERGDAPLDLPAAATSAQTASSAPAAGSSGSKAPSAGAGAGVRGPPGALKVPALAALEADAATSGQSSPQGNSLLHAKAARAAAMAKSRRG